MDININDEQATEEYLQSISTAPRVTLEQVERLLAEVTYWVSKPEGTNTTIASAFLRGFHLADGHSYCVNAENFDPVFGERSAIQKAEANAKDAIWKMLGNLMFAYKNPDLFKEPDNV